MKTDRITLSLITQEDLPEVLDMFQEPDTFKYIKPLLGKTKESYRSFLQLKIEQIESGAGYYWVVRDCKSMDLIGCINVTPIPNTDRTQIGWQICNAHQQKGYAYEAAKLAMEFVESNTTITTVYAVYERENIASEKIIHKLNFDFYETKMEENSFLKIYRRIL